MTRKLWISLACVLVSVVLFATDGPLTPIGNLRGRTDENGYLRISAGTAGATDGPLTPISNLRGRTDENGYLRVACSGCGGGITVDSTVITGGTNGRLLYDNAGTVGETATPSVTTLTATGAVTGVNFINAAAGYFGFTGRATWRSSADAKTQLSDSAESKGITFDVSTNGILNLRNYLDTAVGTIVARFVSAGTAPTVANVGVNSCGTTTATISGNENNGEVTVGATAGTQCRLTFATAATNRRECTTTNETTANLSRSTYVDTTHTDLFGTFAAGDLVTYICVSR